MAEPTIVNYIEISGETFLMEELTGERKRETEILLQERVMEASGYRRTHD